MSNKSDKDIGADELSALFHPEARPDMHDEYTRPAGVDPFVITKQRKSYWLSIRRKMVRRLSMKTYGLTVIAVLRAGC